MRPATGPRRVRVGRTLLGAMAGLALAAVVTLNVHIWAGLDQGYAATPAQVFDHSVLLGVADVVLAVVGATLGALVARRHDRARRGG